MSEPGQPLATLVSSSDGSTLALVWRDSSATDAHRRVAVRPFVVGTFVFTALFTLLGWWSNGMGSIPGAGALGILVGLTAWFGSDRSDHVAWRRILVDRAGLTFDHVFGLPSRVADLAVGPAGGVTEPWVVPWEEVPIVLANDVTLVVGTAVFVLEGLAEPAVLQDFAEQVETARGRRSTTDPSEAQREALAALTAQRPTTS